MDIHMKKNDRSTNILSVNRWRCIMAVVFCSFLCMLVFLVDEETEAGSITIISGH